MRRFTFGHCSVLSLAALLTLPGYQALAATEAGNGAPQASTVQQSTVQPRDETVRTRDGMPEASPLEHEVAAKIHSTNELEIRVGQLAKQRGATAEVRRYGDRLVRDHQLADRMLIDLARSQGYEVMSKGPRPAEAEHVRKLEQLSGPEFDQEFLAMMKSGHDQAITTLTEARVNLPPNSRLRVLIGKILPILHQHDRLAGNIASTDRQGG